MVGERKERKRKRCCSKEKHSRQERGDRLRGRRQSNIEWEWEVIIMVYDLREGNEGRLIQREKEGDV